MPIRIFTIPYNPQTIGFSDEELQKFLLNKNVKSLHPQFFQLEGIPPPSRGRLGGGEIGGVAKGCEKE